MQVTNAVDKELILPVIRQIDARVRALVLEEEEMQPEPTSRMSLPHSSQERVESRVVAAEARAQKAEKRAADAESRAAAAETRATAAEARTKALEQEMARLRHALPRNQPRRAFGSLPSTVRADEIRQAFATFDVDKSGTLDASELRKILCEKVGGGASFTLDEAKELIDRCVSDPLV